MTPKSSPRSWMSASARALSTVTTGLRRSSSLPKATCDRVIPHFNIPWAITELDINFTIAALNNLQSTHEGFGFVKSENVFKVCDEPHPVMVKDMLTYCTEGKLDDAW